MQLEDLVSFFGPDLCVDARGNFGFESECVGAYGVDGGETHSRDDVEPQGRMGIGTSQMWDVTLAGVAPGRELWKGGLETGSCQVLGA